MHNVKVALRNFSLPGLEGPCSTWLQDGAPAGRPPASGDTAVLVRRHAISVDTDCAVGNGVGVLALDLAFGGTLVVPSGKTLTLAGPMRVNGILDLAGSISGTDPGWSVTSTGGSAGGGGLAGSGLGGVALAG
jgi:hypothetical protein